MDVNRYLLGVDLAKSLDFTSFAIIHMEWDRSITDFRYHLKGLDRIRGVDYPKITELIIATIEKLEEESKKTATDSPRLCMDPSGLRRNTTDGPHLCMDASGLGAPIKDYLKESRIFIGRKRIFPVVFVAGESARYAPESHNYNISKTLIMSNFLSLMQHRRFDYAPDLQALPLLEEEIANFKYHFTPSGHTTMDAAAGKHDDLISAVAIPLVIGERWFKRAVIKVAPKPRGL